ncbi:MAG: nuclear transport factor 2 family protein [Candidatus Sulfotelmatobacter sp.]
MKSSLASLLIILVLTSLALAQQPTMPTKFGEEQSTGNPADDALRNMFESKIKAEWEAIKNKDKKAYGDLLADDYQGVEVDGKGERTKLQAMNEMSDQNVANYTLWGMKLTPLGPDAAFAIYESTIQFPPKSAIRYSRVYISELWVKHAGQWKELHYQETHVK